MPRSPCTSNGMAYHWIAQALWHCMTNTQSVGNYQQGHPKLTAAVAHKFLEQSTGTRKLHNLQGLVHTLLR